MKTMMQELGENFKFPEWKPLSREFLAVHPLALCSCTLTLLKVQDEQAGLLQQ